jgi:acyl-CoA reductase-like NAD-dependent aldehyde dehydrogenase
MTTPRRYGLFINGEFCDASSGKTFESINPATGECIAVVAEGDGGDIDRAVQAAAKAFPAWSKKAPSARAKALAKMAQLVDANKEELARLETLDVGKPINDSLKIDLVTAVDAFEYFAGIASKIEGETVPVPGRFLNFTVREPYGVVGGITPWNYPLLQAIWKIAPAVAAGNTVVIKPAEQAPLTTLELGRLSVEAGFPPGVVNIVSGYGETAGHALVTHPLVRKIAFTGSTEVGKLIARNAAETLKPVSLELGGKSPFIVFADADMDAAVSTAFFSIFSNMGEVCTAGSRLFLEASIHDDFLEKLKARAQKIVLGDPMDTKTTMGPLISKEQLEKVEMYVGLGRQEGAKLVLGGSRPADPSLARGFFFTPTIFDGVQNRMRIAQEEIFGPVLSVLTFQNEEEGIRLANDTIYGLAASVFSRDGAKALRVATALEAGNMWVNTWGAVNSASPYGGYKMSGYGREMGFASLELYTQLKSVWVNLR